MFTVKLYNNDKQIKTKDFEEFDDAQDFAQDFLGDSADYYEILDSDSGEIIEKEEMTLDEDWDLDTDDFGTDGFDEFNA